MENKKIKIHKDKIQEFIVKNLPIKYILNEIDISLGTFRKYYPEYKTNRRKITDVLDEENYKANPTKCKQCGEPITWQLRSKTFCSSRCSAQHSNAVKKQNRIANYNNVKCRVCKEDILLAPKDPRKSAICTNCKPQITKRIFKQRGISICPTCTRQFKIPSQGTRFCSKNCWLESIKITKNEFEIYKTNCKFNFNIFDFPDYFQLDLINQHGWYSASNKNNNLNGISRDHIFSVKEGFTQKIDPQIISHPANCRLIPHKENQCKNSKCGITLDELIASIKIFNNKYNFAV